VQYFGWIDWHFAASKAATMTHCGWQFREVVRPIWIKCTSREESEPGLLAFWPMVNGWADCTLSGGQTWDRV